MVDACRAQGIFREHYHYHPEMPPPATAGSLDVLCSFVWNPVHGHDINPLKVDAMADHVRGNERIEERRMGPLRRILDLVDHRGHFSTAGSARGVFNVELAFTGSAHPRGGVFQCLVYTGPSCEASNIVQRGR